MRVVMVLLGLSFSTAVRGTFLRIIRCMHPNSSQIEYGTGSTLNSF